VNIAESIKQYFALLISLSLLLFFIFFFDGWYLQDCPVALRVVDLFVLDAEKGPLGSPIALRQALYQRN
jgi:hypothetical protein